MERDVLGEGGDVALPRHADKPLVCRQLFPKDLEQRRFARSISSDHTHVFPAVQPEADVRKERYFPDRLGEVLY